MTTPFSALTGLAIAIVASSIMIQPAPAQPSPAQPTKTQPLRSLEITSDTKAFKDRELKLGKVRLQVTYQPLTAAERLGNATTAGNTTTANTTTAGNNGASSGDRLNLTYKIFNDGKLQLTESVSTSDFSGQVSLLDLDNNLSPEVIVKTFSGGSHCCTTLRLYAAQAGTYQKAVTLEGLDGLGGEFKDLDGNGSWEFVSSDNAFLYAFSGYAQSFPPSQIFAWSNGKFTDVTRRYPKELRARAWRIFQALQEMQQGGSGLSNHGLLAGYVAQKILLGEYESGWQLMLSRYNPKDPPKDFPTVLKTFLMRQGYLKSGS